MISEMSLLLRSAELTVESGYDWFATVNRATDRDTPLILMGYLNSFERAGFARAMADIAAAGGDAVILVDCPVEALADYDADLKTSGITPIMLVAPTTTADRRQHILAHAGGFLYFVSLRGVTGTQEAQADAIAADAAVVSVQLANTATWLTRSMQRQARRRWPTSAVDRK